MSTPRIDARPFHCVGLIALVAALGFVPAALGAQQQDQEGQQGQDGPQAGPPQAADLVFEREVFTYPSFERRNPFRPLVGREDAGPRYESMRLQAIIFVSDNPEQSMVLMRAGGGGEAPAQTQRLRTGQSWGNLRVVEIRRTDVLVEVEEFGITEQRVMQLPTPGQGGS